MAARDALRKQGRSILMEAITLGIPFLWRSIKKAVARRRKQIEDEDIKQEIEAAEEIAEKRRSLDRAAERATKGAAIGANLDREYNVIRKN